MAGVTSAGLSLRDLEYAVAVGRLRHFGQAAVQCGVSQSALSEQIRKLESVLGVVLFERTTRRVDPTPTGAALLRRAEAIIAGARELLEAARVGRETLADELRLGVIPTLGPYYVPSLLREVRERFPRLTLRLREARTSELLAALRGGDLDAVLLAFPAAEDGLAGEALFFEPFRLVCPAGHDLARREILSVADLRREGLLLLEEGHCLRDQALSLCEAGPTDQPSRFASSLEMLRHMIAAGEGFSLLPLLAVGDRPELDGLVAVRSLGFAEAGRTIGLLWRGSDPRHPDFAELAGFLRNTAPEGTVVAASRASAVAAVPSIDRG